jgi:hypothetical protein
MFNGCLYAGQFAACGTESKAWVMTHNIAAVFPNYSALVLHDLCLRDPYNPSNTIVVTVIDECRNTDCGGCCTTNSQPSGNLIDLESFTDMRWGVPDEQIDWADLGLTTGKGCN